MSRRFELQDATGVVLRKAPIGVLYILQTADPTNGQAGYAPGCFWINTSGAGVGHFFWVNTGTNASTTWTNVT